jgi:2',3'-cyclic-nucleotide 2'-phosphodiesterase (5'-nucleotidase family)
LKFCSVDGFRLVGSISVAAVCGALFWSSCAAAPPSEPARNIDTLTILHTNDMHAQLLPDDKGRGGWAAIASVIKARKQSRPDVLALDAGDMTQGTPVSSIFYGRPIFQVMNASGYDFAVLGNHEFDNGTSRIREFREIADFPLLSANVLEHGELVADAPTALVDVDGVRVGIIGITTRDSIHQEGLSFLTPEQVVARYIPELDERAHLIVVLSHLGHERERKLALASEGIDVIVGGHTNAKLEAPVKVGNTWIAQAGPRGRLLGELNLTLDLETEEILSVEGRLIPIPAPGSTPDPETLAIIQEWEGRVAGTMNVKIGYNPKEQSISTLKQNIERVWLATYRTDFAHQNPGGTRAYLPAGDILVRHIWNAMPFDNTLAVVDLTAEEIRTLMPDAAFDEPKQHYTVITNSYAGERMRERFNLPPERIHPIDTAWREPILDYVRKHGHLDPD